MLSKKNKRDILKIEFILEIVSLVQQKYKIKINNITGLKFLSILYKYLLKAVKITKNKYCCGLSLPKQPTTTF